MIPFKLMLHPEIMTSVIVSRDKNFGIYLDLTIIKLNVKFDGQ